MYLHLLNVVNSVDTASVVSMNDNCEYYCTVYCEFATFCKIISYAKNSRDCVKGKRTNISLPCTFNALAN